MSTATGTPSPSATSEGCAAYHDVVYGFTFEGACLSGETVTNVTITPPSLLHSGTSLSLPSISVGRDGAPTLPLSLPDFGFTFAGLSVRATGNVLGSKGLSITKATVTLPSDLGGGDLTGALTIDASGITGLLTKSDTTLAVAGFTTSVKQITLDNSGLRATGVTLTLPPTFDVAGKATTLRGEFQVTRVNGKNAFSGVLSLAKPSFSAYGFVVSATSIDLTERGLTIANPSLQLPASFRKVTGVSMLALSSIALSSGFKVSARSEGFSFTYAGAHLTTGPIDLSSAGIGMPGASITLPKEFGGKTFTLSPSTIGASGDVADKADAKSKPLLFKIADMTVTASGFSFDKGALTLASATAALPAFQDSLTLQGLSFDGSRMSIAGGGAKITLPTIKAGGFNISASASLLLSDDGGRMTYDFVGSGTVVLKSVGALHVALELGSIAPSHPSNLYSAELDLQIRGAGTPIAGTPLLITGLNGAIHIQPKYASDRTTPIPGSAIYTFSLGLHLKTDDDGFTYHGDATATVASDGNFSFGTRNSQLFKVFIIKGGVCIRVIAQPDNVCSAVLPLNGARVDQSPSTGFYAEISVSRDLEHNGRTVSIGGSAYAHIWADGAGPELAATADAHVVIPAGALVTLVPPFGISVKASAQIGKFSDKGATYKGVKAAISAGTDQSQSATVSEPHTSYTGWDCSQYSWYNPLKAVCKGANGLKKFVSYVSKVVTSIVHLRFNQTIFISSDGSLKWSNIGGYSLIDPGLSRKGNASIPRTMLGIHLSGVPAATSIEMVGAQVLHAPAGVATVTVPMTITRGQTDAVFDLTWRKGAPTFYLLAPDGRIYSPAPGTSTTSAGLGSGIAGAYQLAFPEPLSGVWTVAIGNLQGDEGYNLTEYATTPAPSLSVTTPAPGAVVTAHPLVLLSGRLTGNESFGHSVTLYEGTTPTMSAATSIATGVLVVNGVWTYVWNTARVAAGAYHVYAVLDDGLGPNVVGASLGLVRVVQPAHPAAPRSALSVRQGAQLRVLWTPPVYSGLVAGYKLYWRESAMAKGTWQVLDLGDVHNFVLGATHAGATYQAAIAAYDVEGHEGPRIAAAAKPLAAFGSTFGLVASKGRTRRGHTFVARVMVLPHGAPFGYDSDDATFSVKGMPKGVTVVAPRGPLSLFATSPLLLRVVVSPRVKVGTYKIEITARQVVTERTVTVPLVFVVTR